MYLNMYSNFSTKNACSHNVIFISDTYTISQLTIKVRCYKIACVKFKCESTVIFIYSIRIKVTWRENRDNFLLRRRAKKNCTFFHTYTKRGRSFTTIRSRSVVSIGGRVGKAKRNKRPIEGEVGGKGGKRVRRLEPRITARGTGEIARTEYASGR
ncbi:hypothetical protein PUN28_017103 [Cardiocondyla obscurior]|uniref:Uncharacterized protein n=1 Tax=Cardiocondyla obscurior TaxID=286306 RepID=A0AAW2EMN5_9HYME